jgi:NADP-dependent 3-hydroxy acid dehydrogenase YdfG
MTSLPQQTALVTGASSGIGQATALALAQAGVNLVLVGRSLERLEAVTHAAQKAQVTVTAYGLDLLDLPQVKSRIVQLFEQHFPINILINNAGMGYTGSLAEMSLENWQKVLDLNLTSSFLCIQGALPYLRQQESSTIINISSIAASQAFPQWGGYSVSKAALAMLSKAIAVEERSHGIRVTLITPGAVNTPIWDTETVDADFDRSQMLTPETVAQAIVHAALLPPGAVIEELIVTPSAGAL